MEKVFGDFQQWLQARARAITPAAGEKLEIVATARGALDQPKARGHGIQDQLETETVVLEKSFVDQWQRCHHRRRLRDQRARVGSQRSPVGISGSDVEVAAEARRRLEKRKMMGGVQGRVNTRESNWIPT